MAVIDTLKKHILVDGFHIVADLENSHESWIVDTETGKEYLDCYSQFASQVLGWNHPYLKEREDCFKYTVLHKLANSDCYSSHYASFVDKFAQATPDFKHYFFIDGGAMGVENALKAAFDWKVQKSGTKTEDLDVVHLKDAFHGRSGYTLSLTNHGFAELNNPKTMSFPKFNWTRVLNPKIDFSTGTAPDENESLYRIRNALKRDNVAAIILEPIQGEGGDNHFRQEFFVALRELANEYDALLIFDEVQTGVAMTGKMWCYQHFGVVPDLMCFGKKTQVCGFCSTGRIDEVENNVFHVSSRINSTWGGNLVDMVRSTVLLQAVEDLHLVERAKQTGAYFLDQLSQIKSNEISNIRGRGLMIAIDLPTAERRNEIVVKLSEHMLVLKCGTNSIRFRPMLTFGHKSVDLAVQFLSDALS